MRRRGTASMAIVVTALAAGCRPALGAGLEADPPTVRERMDQRLRAMKARDEATLLVAAREVLDGVMRSGAMSLLSRLSAQVRETEGEDQIQREIRRQAALMGALRSYELGKPTVSSSTCRELRASAHFEHGAGFVVMELCRESGRWVLQRWESAPSALTRALMERLIVLAMAEQKPGVACTVTCPEETVAVGGEITCRLVVEGERLAIRLRRTPQGTMKVVGEAPE